MSRHRHRGSFRFRDEDRGPSTGTVIAMVAGALAGLAVGVLVMQRTGGLGGMKARLARGRRTRAESEPSRYEPEGDDFEYAAADDFEDEGADTELEERVLEAFRNDPILAERAVDIGSIGEGVIELAGWVEEESESRHAATLARGVPGVETVVNRIVVGDEERRFAEAARRVEEGDPALTETRWEGQGIGTGRRRQGYSGERDRHADPRAELEDRWLSESEAMRNAADRTEGLAERRRSHKRSPRGDRTGGSPVAPTGVPKADHVANPVEGARESGGERTDFEAHP